MKKALKRFDSFEELRDEIEKRGYRNIVGLQAKITKKWYWHMLEVLPPIYKEGMKGFFNSEPLSHDAKGAIHYYFVEDNGKYYCEIGYVNALVSQEELIRGGFV